MLASRPPELSRRDRQALTRKRITGYRALAALRHLPTLMTVEELCHPELFLRRFAEHHHLPVRIPGGVYRAESRQFDPETLEEVIVREAGRTNLARRIKLIPEGLEKLRRVILASAEAMDSRMAKSWPLAERVTWCFEGSGITHHELGELWEAAGAVAAGMSPGKALAKLRLGIPLNAPDGGQFFDPDPIDDDDQQVIRLNLLRTLVFDEFCSTTDWMVRWTFFRPGRQHRRFTQVAEWIRISVDHFAASAAAHLAAAAKQLRDNYFDTFDSAKCAKPSGELEFWMHGYGPVPSPGVEVSAAKAANFIPPQPIDHLAISLAGDPEKGLYEALGEAGAAALRWPWVLRIIDSWRQLIEDGEPNRAKEAAKRMERIGGALAHITGRGAKARPQRIESMLEAADLLTKLLSDELEGVAAESARQRLIALGDVADAHQRGTAKRRARMEKGVNPSDKRSNDYVRLDESAISDALRRVACGKTPKSVARAVVSRAFGMELESLVRRIRERSAAQRTVQKKDSNLRTRQEKNAKSRTAI